MSKRSKSSKQPKQTQTPAPTDPWIGQRTGLIIIAVVSVVLVGLMFWQVLPAMGAQKAILWALGAGASIWVIFGLMYIFGKKIRRRD
jgi:hypothetical protein